MDKLYANKLDNLEEMNKLTKLNHEETENLNGPITSRVIKTSQPSPGPGSFTGEFCKHLKN